MPLFDFTGNAVITALDSAISDTSTSLILTDPAGWPDGTTDPWTMTLDEGIDGSEEKLLCGLRTGSSVAILQRGYDDTTAVVHNPPAVAKHTISATFARDVSQHVHVTSRDDHTQYLNNARHDVTARHPTAVIADDAITAAKLASNAVTTTKVLDGAVTTDKLATNAVGELTKVGNEVRAIAATSGTPSDDNALMWFDTDDNSWHVWDGDAAAFGTIDLRLMRGDPPRASVRRTTFQAVSSTLLSPTVLVQNSVDYDTDSMVSGSSFQPQEPGLYSAVANVEMTISSGSSTTIGWFIYNGTDEEAYQYMSVNQILGGNGSWSDQFVFDGVTDSLQVGLSGNDSGIQARLKSFRLVKTSELP